MTANPSGDVVYGPSESFAEATNVREFMRAYRMESYAELIERTTTELDGKSTSGVEWFWDEVVDYLGLEFYEEYDVVRDDTDGPQFTDRYPGGELDIAHNVLDRHAASDTETRNKVACIWEGEDGDVAVLGQRKPGWRRVRTGPPAELAVSASLPDLL